MPLLIFQLISDFLTATLPQALKLTARRDLAMYKRKEEQSPASSNLGLT